MKTMIMIFSILVEKKISHMKSLEDSINSMKYHVSSHFFSEIKHDDEKQIMVTTTIVILNSVSRSNSDDAFMFW